ncbi:Dolichyl N-acetyl-alpha-D-glucosaminyl phosphate 3-beta-D-2,3-diacetamido-2,3-dideoxy-beta-D-glucuronosyltransferase [uncultured archaeon]|nr:Dolichyl N-acetyl-alpha-D-glucosaminyl phosphate 3-beta-D-2,3-diacetamido-2,3-dideoxy-beta-D-glucuronosyltransferase [uncultured archaeon]
MISIVITSFNESQTIGRAIESFLNQKINEKYELIVSAPDKETQDIVKKYKNVKLFKDPGKGKSYALNIILKKIKGDFLILTDGDVYVSNNSVNELIKKFEEEKVGCVTGKPVPIENRKNKYGYWANFLFDSAHKLREKLYQEEKFLECSGYLWAFRTGIVKDFPLDVAEDTIIPYFFSEKGYKIAYADKALVFVKNVDNWEEWINQKVRTSRAHETLNKYVDVKKNPRTKTFSNEAKGISSLLSYPKNLKEFFWTIELVFARLYMWGIVFMDVYIKKKYHKDNWNPVESTK